MDKVRSIERVIAPPPPHMVGDGFRVHNFFPSGGIQSKQRMSPFFMLDYASKFEFSPSKTPRGVDVHPHRGFETVTIAYHGKIAHHDSAGNKGVIEEGDVQWMTAASGVLHKEYHEADFSKKGGPFQMVQLWVNLPAAYKMTTPRYQELKKEGMGDFKFDGGELEIIAGEFNNVKGPAKTFTPVHLSNLHLKKDGSLTLHFPSYYNTGLLIVKGNAQINGQMASSNHFVLLANDGENINISASEESTILILAGEPIQEPLVAYGPFLMNTWEEIEQAISDFNLGKFGVLD
jgi:redox-sensitive bicupin YhaK (pirin superfamily)